MTTPSDKAPTPKAVDTPSAPPADEPTEAVEPSEPAVFEHTEVDGVKVGEFVGVDDCYKNYASIHGAPLVDGSGE